MQNDAKLCMKSPNLCEIDAETCPLFAYKTLVSLKTSSKSTLQPVKVCSKLVCLEVSWVDFECFCWGGTRLEASWVEFKCFYALVWRSGGFWAFFFWLFLTIFAQSWPMGYFWSLKDGRPVGCSDTCREFHYPNPSPRRPAAKDFTATLPEA